MKKLILLLLVASFSVTCQNKPRYLEVSVEPKEPIIIPRGKTKFGGDEITAPWFTMQSFSLNYNTSDVSAGKAQILAIVISAKIPDRRGGTTPLTCVVDGDMLQTMFGVVSATDARVVLERQVPRSSTGPFICYGFTLPNPIPESFNIPATVKVYAAQIDESTPPKQIGRLTATSRITLK